MGKQTAGRSPAPLGNQHPNPPELDEKDAAEFARLMALAPDPEAERRTQQRAASAPAPSRQARERSRQERVAADFGLVVLEDGSYAKAQPDDDKPPVDPVHEKTVEVGHALSVPAVWGEDDQPIPAAVFRRHRTAVRTFAANVKRDRVPLTHRSRSGRHEHRPGVTRRASSSSSTSSADPGGSDSDESEPPAPRRQCAAPWCDHLIYGPPKQRYCGIEHCDRARAAERQRKRRHGDLTALEREQIEDARRAGYVGEDAFAAPEQHSLSFLWKHQLVDGFDPGEYEALLNRPACRCNGHHIDGGVVGCFKCGLTREAVVSCS